MRIICVDMFIFLVVFEKDLVLLNDNKLNNLCKILMMDIKYIYFKSVFFKLWIDIGNIKDFDFVFFLDFKSFFIVFKWKDKEIIKLI